MRGECCVPQSTAHLSVSEASLYPGCLTWAKLDRPHIHPATTLVSCGRFKCAGRLLGTL